MTSTNFSSSTSEKKILGTLIPVLPGYDDIHKESEVPSETSATVESAAKIEPKNRPVILVIVFLIVLALVAFYFRYNQLNNGAYQPPVSGSTPTPDYHAADNSNPNIARYSLDADGDSIPDFIETEMGSDPHLAVEQGCVRNYAQSCEASTSASSVKKTNILIIFDASGSMAEKADGVTKIQAAKDAVKQFIDTLNTDYLNVALMVYGHKGSNSQADKAYSCSQIDLIYPLGPPNKDQYKTAIDSFSPTGWTPIAGALDKAPSVFAGQEGQNNHIILISDGLEECGGNPVQSAQKLKDSSFKLMVDIIGLNIVSSDQQQLKNIAESTGGTFINATNQQEIYTDLKTRNDNYYKLTAYGNCLWWNSTNIGNCIYTTYIDAHNFVMKNHIDTIQSGIADPAKALERKLAGDLSDRLAGLADSLAQFYWNRATQQGEEQWHNAGEQLKPFGTPTP